MKLRTRLFLLVSGLFLATAIISSFIQSYVLNRSIEKSEQNVRDRIMTLNEENREDLENFAAWLIAETDTNVNALLNNLTSLKIENLRFGPTQMNSKKGTWENAAELLLNFNWIDLIQNTTPQQKATIIPNTAAMKPTYRIGINENFAWVYLDQRPKPYFAIRIPYAENTDNKGITNTDEKVYGVDPIPYLLFDVGSLSSLPFSLNPTTQLDPIALPWTDGYFLHVDELSLSLQAAQTALKANSISPAALNFGQVNEILKKAIAFQGGHLFRIPGQSLLTNTSIGTSMEAHLEDIVVRYTEVNLIWLFLTLFDTGLFGNDLFTFPVPEGIGLFFLHDEVGVGLQAKDVFFPEPVFNDRIYFQQHSTPSQKSDLANSLALMTPPKSNQIYFGNTARFIVSKANQEGAEGFLTIGVDFDKILQNMVLAIRETTLLVHGGKIASAFDRAGKLPLSEIDLPIEQMLEQKTGVVNWRGEAYFYLNLHPFTEIDLHFLLLTPEKKEFALLRDLRKESRNIVESILLNLYITGLILLAVSILLTLRVSSLLTQPIVALARSMKKVAIGKLEEVDIPKSTHHDEISVLCSSFEEMVIGLREKEKMKGVLNKVVSQEIAREILKGNLQLGGEEKKITILFADIRGFSALTQNMAPKDVVNLLNTCMTKISAVIDHHHGVIDKFVGDEVMVIFGAPVPMEDNALKAVLCAQEIITALKEWNENNRKEQLPVVEMGIGIHTGMALVGNMGAANRLNYTATGSCVNLASRICNTAKGMEILISKDTYNEPKVKENIPLEELPQITLKGFTDTITLYRVKKQ